MGMKFLRMQMIPWCLHMMGNHIACGGQFQRPTVGRSIKLIKSDGVVRIYHRPIYASELMMEFPKHMVCRSDSFYIGQMIPPLAGDDKLQLGHNYFLLPTLSFQSVLTFVTLASFASAASSLISNSKSTARSCQPFDIQKTPSGFLRIRVSEDFISQLMEEGHIDDEEENEEDEEHHHHHPPGKNKSKRKSSRVCTTPQLQKDYTQLVGCRRQWKPKLEMIRETREKRKLSSFGMKRRKKSQLLGTHKTTRNHHHHHHHHVSISSSSSCKPPSKTKLKTFSTTSKS